MQKFPFARMSAVAGVATFSLLAACSIDSSTSVAQDDATRAVGLFTQLADSVSRAGGDADMSTAYASLAEAVRMGGRVSPIVVTIDGVPTTFVSTAQYADIDLAPCVAQFCSMIYKHSTLRTLVAWQQSDPRRVIQLSSQADEDPIRAYIYPTFAPFPGNSASLTFFDGKGGTYFGTSGTQKFVVKNSDTPCATAGPSSPTIAIYPASRRCVQADFSISFDGKAEPSSFLTARNTATGSHTLSMPAQPVLGAAFFWSAYAQPQPPIAVTPGTSLPAMLTAKVDSAVTLTLTVTNPNSTAAQVVFNSGKHYDFTITDAATGAPVWTWGMGLMFTQAVSSDTIPANGTAVYSAQWKPATKGTFIATGALTSVSHRAAAKVSFNVP